MASLGPTFVGAGTDQGTNWTSTGNVTAEDGATATLSALPANNGEVLRCTMAANAFSVPAGSNISGILIEVKADYSDAFGGTVTYTKVQLVNGGVNIGTNQATGGPSSGALAYNSFGGANNTCGAALTAAIVNSTTFGVDISFSDSGSGPGQVDVDAVRLTVFYSPAPLVDEMVAAITSMQPVPGAFFARNRTRPQLFIPIMGFPDPHSFTLPNAPEPIHPENYPMEFNPRAPQPERRVYQQILMGEYDPTMFLLGNEPEPLHPENYPPAALLPNPRPGRQAWQFPIMASTDYTSLLSGEAAHPETTRQACADLPRRDWPRQYQPPMERIDPAALAPGAQSTAQVPPSMGEPSFRARTVQPPAVEATSYVWATPGDPALLVAAMQPIGNQAPRLPNRPIAGETLLLDGWSAQQLPPWMQDRPHTRHRPPALQSEAASIAPQHFQDAQVIAWLPPLSLPQAPRRPLSRGDEQGELGGETVDPSAILEFSPMQPLPVARTIVRPSGGEALAVIASPAGLSGLFFEPLEQFTHRRPHAPARIESATVLADLWTSDRQLPDQPSNYRRQIALPQQPAMPGAETVQQPALPTYQILDYDPRGQQPRPVFRRPLPSNIGQLTIDTSRFAEPLAEFPPFSQPIRPAAQPVRQSDLAPPYSEATNAAADSAGFMGMGQGMPLAARARQSHSAQPIIPADLQKQFGIEPMYAPQRHFSAPQQSPVEIIVDRQYNAVPLPSQYQADWIVPRAAPWKPLPPVESASTTVFLVGGNPATFAGSGAFVVVAGAVYSLAPTAGKVVRGSKGL